MQPINAHAGGAEKGYYSLTTQDLWKYDAAIFLSIKAKNAGIAYTKRGEKGPHGEVGEYF